MRFKRPGVRYSKTPEPETPYQRAGQVWDERLGASRFQARNWRLMAFGSLGLSVLMGTGLLWQACHSSITPYVVEVDKQGDVRAVGAAAEAYKPSDAQIANHLARFVNDVRALPLDPIVVRQNWLEAYDYATDRGAAVLNEYARTNDPFGKVGKQSIAVEIVSVVRASPGSFQLRWIERRYENGALAATDRWTAILSIVLQPPGNEAQLRKNPLGIYVNGLNGQWDYMLFYAEHFTRAVNDFEAHIGTLMTMLYTRASADAVGKPTPLASIRGNGGWFAFMGEPGEALAGEELLLAVDKTAMLEAFARTGFSGACSWYLNDADNIAFAAEAPRFGRLTLPVLYIHAEWDAVCDSAYGNLANPMREDCADLTETVVAGGHMLMVEQPAKVSTAIDDWLAKRGFEPATSASLGAD